MSKITVLPAVPADSLPIASLETRVFHDEEFSLVAFGPGRASAENISRRARQFAKDIELESRNGKGRLTKAIQGDNEIVGAAVWKFVRVGDEPEEKSEEEKLHPWGLGGGSVRFCEDAFVKAEKIMETSVEGGDYAKLGVLVVAPDCQRRGIGTALLEEGLAEVDRRGVQCVLAASAKGRGLYKKFGFADFEILEFNLAEYEGGEGCGFDTHVIMHRPAQKGVQREI